MGNTIFSVHDYYYNKPLIIQEVFSHTHAGKEYKIEEHENRDAQSVCISSAITWMEGTGYCYPGWVHFRVMFSNSCTVTVAQNLN